MDATDRIKRDLAAFAAIPPAEVLAATEADAADCRRLIAWARELTARLRNGTRTVTLSAADAAALTEALALASEAWQEHAASGKTPAEAAANFDTKWSEP